MKETVGEMIIRGREANNLSQRELAKIANVSNAEISRIESGEREVPNPKTLRKISLYIGINYNDLMYAAGLGSQVSPLNPFLLDYYEKLKGEELEDALVNTLGSIRNAELVIESFEKRLAENDVSQADKEIMEQTIEDTKYQIETNNEIVKLLHSSKVRERNKNEKKS